MSHSAARIFAAMAILASLHFSPLVIASSKPNFIFIFSDDQAPDTVAAWGNPQVKTPHLDRLSETGTNFMYAYNAGAWNPAVCVPSRAMLNSGLKLWRARAVNHARGLEQVPFWSQVMRDAGYVTYMAGKWHLFVPVGEAFDVVRNVRGGMPDIFPEQHPHAYNRPIEGRQPPFPRPPVRSNGSFRGLPQKANSLQHNQTN